MGRGVALEPRLPLGDQRLRRAGDRLAEMRGGLVGDVERAVRIPAVGLLGQPDLVGSERRAVRLLAVVLVRAAVADVRPDGDQARPVVGARRLDGGFDRGDVVAVLDALGVPAVGIEALGDVLGPGHRGRAVELDVVVVVQDDELAQSQVAGQAGGLRGDALLKVAVGCDDVGPMVDDRLVRR